VAYAVMNRWLEEFAYRTDVGWGLFVLAGLIALLIALLAVSYQSIRAALADPVKSLRYE
jgi:putative ABC transport system permease protein